MRRIRDLSYRVWLGVRLLGLVATVAVLAACPTKAPPSRQPVKVDIPCDIPSQFVDRSDSVSIATFRDNLHAAQQKVCIKEWHDYQRLMRRCNGSSCADEYGPHAYVMAADSLNDWKTPDDFKDAGHIVAEIETNGEYSDLDLVHGHSDLTLNYDDRQPPNKQWTATMKPGLGHKLEVARFKEACCTSADEYPGVTRWEYDKNEKNQLIGVKCGDGWCEIGRKVPPANPHSGPGKPPQRVVPGWFDEQRLAIRSTPGGPLKPWQSGTAEIYPDKDLADYTKPDQFKNKWIHVASIKTPAPYDKLGLKKHDTIESELFLMYFLDDWWANVHTMDESGIEKESAFSIHRTEHNDPIGIPAVARWGWDETDETIWVRCANGCCQIEEFRADLTAADDTKRTAEGCTGGKPCIRAIPRRQAQAP